MAIKAGQKITIGPVAASGINEMTRVGTARICVIRSGTVVIDISVDMSIDVHWGVTTVTCVAHETIHVLGVTFTNNVDFGRGIRVVVTNGAFLRDGDGPLVVGGTAIKRCAGNGIGTIVVTDVGAAGFGDRVIVSKGNTTATGRTDLIKTIDMQVGGHNVAYPVRIGIVAGTAYDRINAKGGFGIDVIIVDGVIGYVGRVTHGAIAAV